MSAAAIVYFTKIYHFNAGHRLFHPDRDDAWNRNVFGRCSHRDGHGHNYELEVSIAGNPDPETGMIVPLAQLDAWVGEVVVSRFDHHNLNRLLRLDDGVAPTSEVFVVEIWDLLHESF